MRRQTLTRRAVLRTAGGGALALSVPWILAGCGRGASSPTVGALSAGSPATAASPAAATRPTIRVAGGAAQGQFEYPQPFGFQTGPGFVRMSYLFDALAWRDSTVKPIPWLAEGWEASSDGKAWTFRLRQGARFHDGQPLTTDDVVFSYQYIRQHATNWYSALVEALDTAEKRDEQQVTITLKAPFAPFLNAIAATVPILPKHIWEQVDDPQKFVDKRAYIGSGPYTLASFSEAESTFLFVGNDQFFLGSPFVRRIEYVPAADQLIALKAGGIDAASPGGQGQGVPNEVLAPFRQDPKYAVLDAPGEATTALHFNLSRGAPYSNVLFRQAVVYAIDRQELVQRILLSNGTPGSAGYLAPSNPYASSNVQRYDYDPNKARALLDQAGYPEQDGQRRKPDGSPLVIPLLFAASLARTAELIRSQLAKVGLTVTLNSVDPGTANQMQGQGNFDLSLVTYGGLGSDPDFMRRAFSSPPQARFWWKAWGYDNPTLNQLAVTQLRTIDDAKRRQIVSQMQQIIAEDIPVMPLYYPTRFLIYVPAVFDAWYFTPLWNPLPMNKHAFVTGQKTGLAIRK